MNKDQTSASIVVDVRGVHKTYQRGSETLDVLQGVDVEVERGEFLALMGPSGSGKTTLLNLIAGIDFPTSGRVIVNGREISSSDEDRLAGWRTHNIGYVFQSLISSRYSPLMKTWSCHCCS